ncbi:MAG: YbjN domain-containing protein [Armatimonadetes bacterium]|nr:YbjN domain-containing protein [Armatimonadota bacterium]
MANVKRENSNPTAGVEDLLAALKEEISFNESYDEENEEWVLDVSIDGQRRQDITLSPFTEAGRDYIRLITVVGKTSDFSLQKLRSALELNSSLLYGALAIYQGATVLTETIAVKRTDKSEAIDIVRYLTRMADSYEKMLFGLDRA